MTYKSTTFLLSLSYFRTLICEVFERQLCQASQLVLECKSVNYKETLQGGFPQLQCTHSDQQSPLTQMSIRIHKLQKRIEQFRAKPLSS